jgi:predicted phosphate transport protein (TIGR00153 family)
VRFRNGSRLRPKSEGSAGVFTSAARNLVAGAKRLRIGSRLRPKSEVFYRFFAAAGENLIAGANLLAELTGPKADAQSVAERLVDVEHANDDVTHQLLSTLNSTFVTPFDREDIHRLGSSLDDVVDHMEAAGNLVYLYQLSSLPALPREMNAIVDLLVSSAEVTAEAMGRLRGLRDLEPYWIEVNRLENEADKVYRMLLVRLFSGEYDALTVLKLKEVADELEAAADGFEHVANTVQGIAVKES